MTLHMSGHAQQVYLHSNPLYYGVDTDIAGPDCGDLFCRFAVSRSSDGKGSCITPIAHRLLRYSERPRRPEFSFSQKPLVFDLTANVLGPAEGFAQSGFSVHSGIGSEQEHTVTWKVSLMT
jgi:hypothetical protein